MRRRKAGTATALFGGNELAASYDSDWAQVDGSAGRGFLRQCPRRPLLQRERRRAVQGFTLRARGARRLPDRLARRPRRLAAIGPSRVKSTARSTSTSPSTASLSVVDQSRCGVLLYTDDGLYVDSIFPDGRRFSPANYGVYPQPGEFFAGFVYPNRSNGKVYFGMGKVSPMLYEAVGWSLQQNPVRRIDRFAENGDHFRRPDRRPPRNRPGGPGRGGDGQTRPICTGDRWSRSRRYDPRLGIVRPGPFRGRQGPHRRGPPLLRRRSLVRPLARPAGHENRLEAAPSDRATVRARSPGRHAEPVPAMRPGAKPGGPAGGRAGDVRIVFGVFNDGATPARSPWACIRRHRRASRPPRQPIERPSIGPTSATSGCFRAHNCNWAPDPDQKGFVLTAAVPRSALPGLPALRGGLQTMINFEATLAGHDKFWWSNADGSASRKPTTSRPRRACIPHLGDGPIPRSQRRHRRAKLANLRAVRWARVRAAHRRSDGADAGHEQRLETGHARPL